LTDLLLNSCQTLNEKGIEISQEFPAGTLLMGIVGAKIGSTAILGFDSYCPDSVVGFYPLSRVNVFFLRYLFIAALQVLESTATQSAQPNLNIERIASIPAVFPEIEEQAKIVQHLDRVDRLLSRVNAKIDESVNLLQERRIALISAAVTGKIDVRNWQPAGGERLITPPVLPLT
jgi:type I restriction enzyme, S subunit